RCTRRCDQGPRQAGEGHRGAGHTAPGRWHGPPCLRLRRDRDRCRPGRGRGAETAAYPDRRSAGIIRRLAIGAAQHLAPAASRPRRDILMRTLILGLAAAILATAATHADELKATVRKAKVDVYAEPKLDATK